MSGNPEPWQKEAPDAVNPKVGETFKVNDYATW